MEIIERPNLTAVKYLNSIPIHWFYNNKRYLNVENLHDAYEVCFKLLYPNENLKNNIIIKDEDLIPQGYSFVTDE